MPDLLTYTLVADGSSDKALMPIVNWLLNIHLPYRPIQGQFADLAAVRQKSRLLRERVQIAQTLYPQTDFFVIHRDAERESLDRRIEEISDGLEGFDFLWVPLVPIRMLEAWLLFDEAAIRKAGGKPSGRVALNLPPVGQLEQVPDPKSLLYQAVKDASGLRGRHLNRLNVHQSVHLVADNIEDFSPLRRLTAFQTFEDRLLQVINAYR